jgi:cysteine desulfurase
MVKLKAYLDYASTTPLDPRVFAAMKPYFASKFGNPMSLHSFGKVASDAVEKARRQTAAFFGCEAREIIFTSGATESNNFAIKGAAIAFSSTNKKIKPHVITTQFEHSCVLSACKKLEQQGIAEVTYLGVPKDGIIRTDALIGAIRPNTMLISVMYVNNEIGTIQPIKEIGKAIFDLNKDRERKRLPKILFHTDAAQAVNYLDCRVNDLGVDFLTASAHKIYGPKGVGCLFIRNSASIMRIQDGGNHEFGLRAGTLNVPGIIGLGEALNLAEKERSKNYKIVEKLRDYILSRTLQEIRNVKINGSKAKRVPNNLNLNFRDVEGEGLLLGLDLSGVAVSTGSACSSGDLKASHVLTAIGIPEEESHGSLRITLGKYTTKKEADCFIIALKDTVERLRKIAGK